MRKYFSLTPVLLGLTLAVGMLLSVASPAMAYEKAQLDLTVISVTGDSVAALAFDGLDAQAVTQLETLLPSAVGLSPNSSLNAPSVLASLGAGSYHGGEVGKFGVSVYRLSS